MAVPGDAMAELVIIRQTVRQRGETADFSKRLSPDENRRAQRKIERLQALRLQHLAPEIGVDRDGFPAHRGRRRIGEPVKTIHERDFVLAERRDKAGEKIRRHAHVGVADENQIVRRELFQPRELGGLGVRARELFADDQLRADAGIFGNEPADDFANGIAGLGDAK